MRTARFVIVVMSGAAIGAAFVMGGIGPQPFLADDTYMCRAALGLTLIGTALAGFGRWDGVRWIANALPYVGLIGTTIGLVLLSELLGVDAGVDELRRLLAGGIGPALFPNMVAAFGYLWLSLLGRLIAGEDI